MDDSEAAEAEEAVATPIFSVYRRGYDPEQVDRYVSDQQRRLDEASHRASESERKLAAAVGQLRELHRRVAVYESEARSAQPPQLDTLGERVQRILQEAWEGAYNLRQEAEREVNEMRDIAQREVEALREQVNKDVEDLREVASREAAEVVDEATRRALHIRDETERRRQLYLERVERDREQAIAQITYLYDQRQGAVSELARLQATIQATIEEMVRSPLGRPAPGVAEAAAAAGAAAGTARRSPKDHAAGRSGTSPAERAGVFEDDVIPPSGEADAAAVEALLAAGDMPIEADAAADPGAGDARSVQAELPTGPMERLVRPGEWVPADPPPRTDEPRHRRSGRPQPARAEADQMERMMKAEAGRQGPADLGTGGGAGTSAAGAGASASRVSTAGTAGTVDAVDAGMERVQRRAPARHEGVYDAEAEGWT
jgi:hypothetical protein